MKYKLTYTMKKVKRKKNRRLKEIVSEEKSPLKSRILRYFSEKSINGEEIYISVPKKEALRYLK